MQVPMPGMDASALAAPAARDKAITERDKAITERDSAIAQRDSLYGVFNGVIIERDRALADLERARADLMMPYAKQAKTCYDRIREARTALRSYVEARRLIGDQPAPPLHSALVLLSEALDALLPDRPLMTDERRTDDESDG